MSPVRHRNVTPRVVSLLSAEVCFRPLSAFVCWTLGASHRLLISFTSSRASGRGNGPSALRPYPSADRFITISPSPLHRTQQNSETGSHPVFQGHLHDPVVKYEIENNRDCDMHDIPETGFLHLPQVLSVIPLGKTCWWEGVRSGRFPKPVKLSERCTAWRSRRHSLAHRAAFRYIDI